MKSSSSFSTSTTPSFLLFFQPQIFPTNTSSFLLTSSQNCYVWGSNDRSQLGLGDKEGKLKGTLLTTLPNNKEKISQLSAGYQFPLCLTGNGFCYGWGANYFRQLGLGDQIQRNIPTLLTSLPTN